MKRAVYLLTILSLAFMSCNKPRNQGEHDYASFVFEQTTDNLIKNIVVGLFDDYGDCIKIAELGDLSKAGEQTVEVTTTSYSVPEVFLFADMVTTVRFDKTFKLKKNTKTIFKITEDIPVITVDKTNPKEYPH